MVRRRGRRSEERISAQWVVNCTGPDTNLAQCDDPLIEALRTRGIIRPDELGLGIESTPEALAVGRDGHPVGGLYIAGPLRKADYWEQTAIPELRVEVAALATCLVAAVAKPVSGRISVSE
jgi:uncharacterized NAD(P)/FAD-binding protein YdhS